MYTVVYIKIPIKRGERDTYIYIKSLKKPMVYLCNVCGRSFAMQQQLNMHSTVHMNNQIEGVERKHPPENPPKESTSQAVQNFKYPKTAQEVEAKRAELEILRIEKEIERLNKPETPDTKLDYFSKMLELQQLHNNQMMTMQQQNFNVMLELEKVKLGQGGEDNSYLTELFKYLPQIMAAKAKESQNKPETKTEPKKEVKEVKHTKKELETYRTKIMKGEITEEQAYNDFVNDYPEYSKVVSRELFKKKFEEVKAGKPLNI